MLIPPFVSLAKRLTGVAPVGLNKAFFLSTSGESNEAVVRLANIIHLFGKEFSLILNSHFRSLPEPHRQHPLSQTR
jgi:4-aminobutyrate aminotransferase-like enzyme